MVIERPIIGFTGWEGGPRHKLSRGAWIAIGASAAVHVAGALYLYNLHTAPPRMDMPPEPAPIVFKTIRLAPPPPQPKAPPTNIVKLHPPADPIPTTTTTLKFPPQPADLHPAELKGPPVISPDVVTPPTTNLTSTQPPSKTIRNPTWLARPTPEQLTKFYPSSALDEGLSGQAILDCFVTASGQLTRCAISGETPPGRHFGDAALKASRIFRMSPKTEDGQPVEGGTIHIPIHFAVTN